MTQPDSPQSRGQITISHSPAESTLIGGSRKGDGVWEILMKLRSSGQGNWRFSREVGLYLGQSRDKAPQIWKIEKAAGALRAAGWAVEIDINLDDQRSFADAEADRIERAEERADRHAGYADNAASRSAAAINRVHQIGERFAGGQPILVGHHSERGARADQQRMDQGMRRSIAEDDKSTYHAERAAAAGEYQARREDIPRTLRRLKKLQAARRDLERRLNGAPVTGNRYYTASREPATGEYRMRVEAEIAYADEQIAYWEAHVAKAQEESDVKVWGPSDFTTGDFVPWFGAWAQVLRINAKSVTVAWGANFTALKVITKANARDACEGSGWTCTVPYDEVRGHKTADEIAPLLAAQEAAFAQLAEGEGA